MFAWLLQQWVFFGDIIPVYVYLYFRHLISWGLMVLDHNNVTRI